VSTLPQWFYCYVVEHFSVTVEILMKFENNSAVFALAGQYADAFFCVAKKIGEIQATSSILDKFACFIESSDDLRILIDNPVFSSGTRLSVVSKLLDNYGFCGCGADCIKLLTRNGRLNILSVIAKSFRSKMLKDRGELEVEVITACSLSGGALEALRAALAGVSDGRDIIFSHTVDPFILGGLVVYLGDLMIDTSIRTKLSSLTCLMEKGNK